MPLRYENRYDLGEDGYLAVRVIEDEAGKRLEWVTDLAGEVYLHWGVARSSRHEWHLPPEELHPPGTTALQGAAAQTLFVPLSDGVQAVRLELRGDTGSLIGIPFVLLVRNRCERWIKNQGRNFFLPVGGEPPAPKRTGIPDLDEVAAQIIESETRTDSWTLMHRFDLCHDLLARTGTNPEGLALLYVWLRFSAIRQLDWQRNYNTKPRELSHSLERLTGRLAELYGSQGVVRGLIRLMLGTLGRGGEGQRIRDGILEIMHRHHLKEVAGTFMEEWHQKMHNNATPDDMVICEAYLDFLRSDGNLEVFYTTLKAGGVSRERLESYERPLKTAPDFIPDLKDALLRDFQEYLQTLKAVHLGVDLETAVATARGSDLDDLFGLVRFVLDHRDDPRLSLTDRAGRMTEARRRLADRLREGGSARDLLFLDLSLEAEFRRVVEGTLQQEAAPQERLRLIGLLLENLLLTEPEEELGGILAHLRFLLDHGSVGRKGPPETAALLDRLEHSLAAHADRLYALVQPKARVLGEAFGAEAWTIELFGQEVVRGTLSFVLSALARKARVALSAEAPGSGWHAVSPGRAAGELSVVADLAGIQHERFERPAVILARSVSGTEEIPPGVTAIISCRGVDVLSHLAIRARNEGVVFAFCDDPHTAEGLRALGGRPVSVIVEPPDRLVVSETAEAEKSLDGKPAAEKAGPQEAAAEAADASQTHAKSGTDQLGLETPTARPAVAQPRRRLWTRIRPHASSYAVPSRRFRKDLVGPKSLNLVRLQYVLPDWVSVPTSVAVPFGVFDRVLAEGRHREAASQYHSLVERVAEDPAARLAEIRKIISSLVPPDGFIDRVQEALKEEGLFLPNDPGRVWACIKRVWASKWTDRAWLSRVKQGIPHEEVYMAVLIQQVVEAEYAFVMHTVNPLSGARGEIYGEVVPGLGETLTSSYPGSALGFTCSKETLEPRIETMPSKSLALSGGGLIFRSDSSAEDLPGYAGAGLYESVTLEPLHQGTIDYRHLPLLRDDSFRKGALIALTRIGIEIERSLSSPQDIEGVFSRGGPYCVVQSRPQVGVADG